MSDFITSIGKRYLGRILIKDTGEEIVLPYQKNVSDTGWDITAKTHPSIIAKSDSNGYYSSIQFVEYGTGLFVEPSEFQYGKFGFQVRPRSSICNYSLVLSNSIITVDEEYRGEILLRFKYIVQPEDLIITDGKVTSTVNWEKIYKKGDRIGQIVPEPLYYVDFVKTAQINMDTNRGAGGFGSTGK